MAAKGTRKTATKSGTKKKQSSRKKRSSSAKETWNLRLYVAGNTPKSKAAMENLQKFCDEHLPGQCTIEVIDLIKNPRLASGDQILAIPTLVRKIPSPMRKIIGDLSNKERMLVGFNIRVSS